MHFMVSVMNSSQFQSQSLYSLFAPNTTTTNSSYISSPQPSPFNGIQNLNYHIQHQQSSTSLSRQPESLLFSNLYYLRDNPQQLLIQPPPPALLDTSSNKNNILQIRNLSPSISYVDRDTVLYALDASSVHNYVNYNKY